MELAGAEGAFLGVEVLDGVETDGVEADGRGVPVGGGFDDVDVLTGAPILEDERAVADERVGTGPAVAAGVG